MTVATLPTTIEAEIYYPDTDGKPMAESDFQRQYLTYLVEALDFYFEADPNVYVSGNLLIYYEKGNPKVMVAPDVFVVFGVKKKMRSSYKLWEEGQAPAVVIEIISPSTKRKDETEKLALYQSWDVKEYFLYNPTQKYLDPPLRGYWQDAQGQYEEMIGKWHDEVFILESHVLGLELHQSKDKLRLFNPKTKEYIDSFSEQAKARKAEARRADFEARRADFEAKIADSEARRADSEAKRADSEAKKAKAQEKRADSEAKARAKAEAEMARLRALLASLGIDQSAE